MSTQESLEDSVLEGLPASRLQSFLDAANRDKEKALELYAWNARMSGAALEQISYVEVLLRHAVDTQLSKHFHEEERGIPWFLLPVLNEHQQKSVQTVRDRLGVKRETRDRVIAGLSFGFWSGWFGIKNDQLWREALHHAFRKPSGKPPRRKDISSLVEQIRKFRNRIAHHHLLLETAIWFEMESIFQLAEMINPATAQWMRSVDRTRDIAKQRPVPPLTDTVIVPAKEGWPFYQKTYAYVCQPGRYFQDVKHMAFYADQMIQPEIPFILSRTDNVRWTMDEATKLKASKEKDDRKIGAVIEASLAEEANKKGSTLGGRRQVFLLSRPSDPRHITLNRGEGEVNPLRNTKGGKGSAFVQKQRYTSIYKLKYAESLDELKNMDKE